MSTSPIRWGLLSTAHINRHLIPAIRASARGELVAVASRSQTNAETYAAQWDIPYAFGSYQAMLDSGIVDAVYIGLPNHLHAEWSIRALHSGVHVLCEKPFATSLEEVDRMIAASQQTGQVLAEAFMYRHHPQTKLAGEWAHSGRLGEIILVRGEFTFLLKDRTTNVRMIPAYGGGCLWDIGVYPLSFAQFIYSTPPVAVSGIQYLGNTEIDESFIGQMTYPSGGLAQISSSFRSPYHTSIDIIGVQGRLSLNWPFTVESDHKMIFYPVDGGASEIPVPEQELYIGEIDDMHAAILDEKLPYLSLSETRNHVRTALALYESARSGQIVKLA